MKNLAIDVTRESAADPYAQFADAMVAERRVTSGDYSGASRIAKFQCHQHGEIPSLLNSPQVECLGEKVSKEKLKPFLTLGIGTDPYGDEAVRVQNGGLVATGVRRDANTDENGKISINEFLRPVTRLEKLGHVDAALDVLYDRIEDRLKAKEFQALDELFQQATADSISVDIILGLLTATLPARKRLPTRPKFFAAAEKSIKTRGEWEQGLLNGLE